MNKKIIISVITIGIIAVAAIIVFSKTNQILKTENTTGSAQSNNFTEITPIVSENQKSAVKEFTMTSFVEIVDGKPKPQYSIKEITVNKGDRVRIKITVTSGMHNFNLDEFNIHSETSLNQETIVEFIADKSGEFIYYCSKPGHRENGHWGTLKVLDK